MESLNATKGSFFVTGGAVRPDAPSYVERQCDQHLLQALRHGEFCYVLTSRQMGKSSLVVHTAKKLRQEDVALVVWDLTAIGQNLTPEQWYDGLCVRMGELLGREEALDAFWTSHRDLGPCQRLFTAIREVVLPAVRHLVVFVDEIDMVRSLPFTTDEFFAAVRESYNRRVVDPLLERMTFCLLGVASPSDLIKDTRMTPFNIGQRIELNDFTDEEAAPLARGFQCATIDAKKAESLLRRILHWTQGHPYLTQRLCQSVVESGCEEGLTPAHCIELCCEKLFFSHRARERDDNLIFVRERLLRSEADRANLLNLYQEVLRGRRVTDDEINPMVSLLRLSGVVQQSGGRLTPRNRIYERTFNRAWIQAHLPDAELKSQREAYNRGVIRTTSIAAIIIAAMTVMIIITFNQFKEAERASGRAFVSQARSALVSSGQGQQYNALDAIASAVPIFGNMQILRDLIPRALALPDLRPMDAWPHAPDSTIRAAVNADFSLYACANEQGQVSVRPETQSVDLALFPGSGLPVEALVFSPDSSLLAILSRGDQINELRVWKWREKQPLLRITDPINKTSIAFSPDSRQIAVGMSDGTIGVHALEPGETPVLTLVTRPARPADQLSFHPFEPLLASCSDNSLKVRLWDLQTGQLSRSFFYAVPVHSLSWHPHGKVLAAGCKDGDICLWYYGSPSAPWKVLRGFKTEVNLLAYSHSGHLLASLSVDKTLRLWVPEVERNMTYFLQREEVQALAFKDDDACLGLWQVDSELQCLEIAPTHAYRTFADPAGEAQEFEDIDLSPDGKILAAATDQGLLIWDVKTGRRLGWRGFTTIRTVCFDPPSGQLFANDSVGVWQWTLSRVDGPQGYMLNLEPNNAQPDAPLGGLGNLGKMALAAEGTMTAVIRQFEILLHDPTTGEKPFTLSSDTLHETLALSPDGKILAARTSDTRDIHLWDTQTRTRVETPLPIQGGPELSFSPDGRWFCASTPDGYAIWNARHLDHELIIPCNRPAIQPGLIAFSGKTGLMAIALAPSTVGVVRLPEGELLVRLESPDRRPLVALAFSHDGRTLATAARERVAIVWDLGTISSRLTGLNLEGDLPGLMMSDGNEEPWPKKPITKSLASTGP